MYFLCIMAYSVCLLHSDVMQPHTIYGRSNNFTLQAITVALVGESCSSFKCEYYFRPQTHLTRQEDLGSRLYEQNMFCMSSESKNGYERH